MFTSARSRLVDMVAVQYFGNMSNFVEGLFQGQCDRLWRWYIYFWY